jgi:hypothetical protein
MPRECRHWVCALMLLPITACMVAPIPPQLSDMIVEPGLDEAALNHGGVAILGFEGLPANTSDAQRDLLDYPLYAALKAYHPQLPLTGAKTTRAYLRKASIDERVHYLIASERLRELPFEELRVALPGRRWLLSAGVKDDAVDRAHVASDDYDQYCVQRGLRIRYRLVNLASEQLAFQVDVRRSDETCNRNPRSHEARDARKGGILGGLLVDLIVDGLTNAMFGTYPGAPELVPLATRAAVDMASVLPGARLPTPTVRRQDERTATQMRPPWR